MLPKSDSERRGGAAPVDGVDGWAGSEGAHLGKHDGEGRGGEGRGGIAAGPGVSRGC